MADPITAALLKESGAAQVAQPAQVAAPQQAANDPITASLLAEAKTEPSKSVPDSEGALPSDRNLGKTHSLMERVQGAGEAALALGTGIVAAPVGAAAGLVRGLTGGKYGTAEGGREASARAAEIAASLTFQPRTETGQETLDTLGKIAGATKLAGLGPTEAITLGGLSAGPRAAARAAPAAERAAQAMPGKLASVGASGVAPGEQARALVVNASPELRAAVENVAPKLDARGLQTVERHAQADTLPVPIKLTAGQATQDVNLLSQEQNARAAKPQIAARLNEQNVQLTENVNAIRERAAPDVYATSRPELGEALIDAYKAKDAALNKDISAKYQALRDANGGAFPLDAKAFVSSADAALHKGLLYDHLPPTIRATLDRLKTGGKAPGAAWGEMTFENFEALRTNLARIQRSQTADGNAKAAAGVVRDAMEAMPLPPEAAHLKPLADAARSAAKERFALIEADPAYKAVTRGKSSADKFVDKYVIGADTKNVETMKTNLAHDPVAQQTMSAGAMQRLKESAGILDNQGNFSQAGYNKALESLRPKLGILFSPEDRTAVENLGSVARYVKGQPTGSFVNTSNTAVTLMGEAAKQGVAGAANVAAGGVPIGTWARKGLGYVAEQRELARSLKPGAGITLKEITK